MDPTLSRATRAAALALLTAATGCGRSTPLRITVRDCWAVPELEYRKQLTVYGAQLTGVLGDFPLLVSLTDPDLTAHAQDDGSDLRFIGSDPAAPLAYEIEQLDLASGRLLAWVRLPRLSPGVDTDLFLYYGGSDASPPAAADSVWSAGFVGVWHLNGEPTAAAPQQRDSTSHGNHGSCQGGMPASARVPGIIGDALAFDGVDDFVMVAEHASLDATTALTASFWNRPLRTPDNERPLTKSSSWNIKYNGDIDGEPTHPVFSLQQVSQVAEADWTVDFSGRWQHVAAVFDASGVRWVIDGTPLGNLIYDVSATTLAPADSGLFIGAYNDSPQYTFLGLLDEVRVATVARDDAWLQAEFLNQARPEQFYRVGPEERRSPHCTDAR